MGLDEMGLGLNLTRQYGRAPRGERVYGSAPFRGGGRHTLLGAITSEGPLTEIVFEGYLDTEIFRLFVRDYLVPHLYDGQVVIMDNLKIHKDPQSRQLIERTGARIIELPPYCPELNPIELTWSKIKQLIRSREPRDFDELVKAVAWAIRQVTEQDARGWYRHCGFWEC